LVEIDECKIGKRKYNRGKLVEGTWVLGMIEINTDVDREKREKRGGRYRLEICAQNKRDASTLIPLIIKHVKPGTINVTDLWKSYFGLTSAGFEHFTVNHSKNFIDPITTANNQTIESSWRSLKRSIKSGVSSDNLVNHLCEYLYRREVKMSNEDPFFFHFIKAIRKLYPGLYMQNQF
jgi:transposase-like protein